MFMAFSILEFKPSVDNLPEQGSQTGNGERSIPGPKDSTHFGAPVFKKQPFQREDLCSAEVEGGAGRGLG